MASEFSLFLSLLNNLSVFILLIAGYGFLNSYLVQSGAIRRQLVLGLFFGLIVLASMHIKIPVTEGVFVDQRNALIALSGVFGGPVATLLSASMAAAYRAHLGGAGALSGIIGILLASTAGLIVFRFRDRIDSVPTVLASSLFMVLLILPGFLFVGDLAYGWALLQRVAVPYGVAIFLGIFLGHLLLAREDRRRRTEREAQAAEKRLSAHAENTPLGVIEWDVDFKVTQWNRAAERIFGYTKQEAIGRHAFDLIVTEVSRSEIEEVWQSLLGKKGGTQSTNQNKTRDGRIVTCEWYNTVITDDAENVSGVASLVLDITERQSMEDKMRLFYHTIEHASDAVFWINERGRFDYVNKQACESLGYTADELKSLYLWEINRDISKEWFDEAWARFHGANSPGTAHYEVEHTRKDGSVFPTEVDANHFLFDGSELHVAFTRDISKRREAAEELLALRNYLSSIINSMPSMLVGVDDEWRITQWNRTAEKSTGIGAGEALGRHLPAVLSCITWEMEKISESIESHQIIENLKKPRVCDGDVLYEDITIYPLVTNSAKGAVIRIDDVTAQVHLEELMIQNKKMLSVGGLAAGMAHEINNPLAGILQTAEVLSSRLSESLDSPVSRKVAEDTGADVQAMRRFMEARSVPRMLSTISDSGKRISGIIKNMLSFARKSDSTLALQPIDELLDKTLDLAATDYDLKKQYDFKMMGIVKEYAVDLPPVPCEAEKIQQVFLNLLRNAAQAMQMAGTQDPTITLRIYHRKALDCVCVEIEDSGPGMDEKTRKRVFEPFFTTKPEGVGTGLGLSVSYFIITENHRGKMSVESAPGEGTTFVLCLPLEIENTGSTSARVEQNQLID